MSDKYCGIDFKENILIASYYEKNMMEPFTLSQYEGSEDYGIPYALSILKEGNTVFGKQALDNTQKTTLTEKNVLDAVYYNKAYRLADKRVDAVELMEIYLSTIIKMALEKMNDGYLDDLVFTTEKIEKDFSYMADSLSSDSLGIRGKIKLIDHKEAFAYYALSQSADLKKANVALFDFDGKRMMFYCLLKKGRSVPYYAAVREETEDGFYQNDFEKTILDNNENERKKLDARFSDYVKEKLSEGPYSAVYLVGDGFEGDWMKLSVDVLCGYARVFLGQNLFSKGACYYAMREKATSEEFIYLGESKTRADIEIALKDKGKAMSYPLCRAGRNWYDEDEKIEVILEGEERIDLVLRSPDGTQDKVEVLDLKGLEKRPNRMTRLSIKARPSAEDTVRIRVEDLGFGDIYPSGGKVWEYKVTI